MFCGPRFHGFRQASTSLRMGPLGRPFLPLRIDGLTVKYYGENGKTRIEKTKKMEIKVKLDETVKTKRKQEMPQRKSPLLSNYRVVTWVKFFDFLRISHDGGFVRCAAAYR
jgi:hypothetical protein